MEKAVGQRDEVKLLVSKSHCTSKQLGELSASVLERSRGGSGNRGSQWDFLPLTLTGY